MIDSPTHIASDIGIDVLRSIRSSTGELVFDEKNFSDRMSQLAHTNLIQTCFIRISWNNKLKLLIGLTRRISNPDSIELIINTLYPVFGKIQLYNKSTATPKMPYDTILWDHNRMLLDDMVEDLILRDLRWFEGLADKDQVALLINLLRSAGGALIRKMYAFLREIQRDINRIASEKTDETRIEEDAIKKLKIAEKNPSLSFTDLSYDPEDPANKECLRLRKAWQEEINKYRKDVEKESARLNNEKTSDDVKAKDKKKKGKKKKTAKNKKDDSLDWLQVMPICMTKKIFSYLDKKTLIKLKKVNEYWKWAIEDLFKEWKVQKLLDKTIKDITKSYGSSPDFSYSRYLEEPKERVSYTEKRMQKLYQRGAILEKLRYIRTKPLDRFCLMLETLKDLNKNYANRYVNEIVVLPRVTRTNSPLMKKPSYICKDYKIICVEEANEESQHFLTFTNSQLSSLLSSDVLF